MPRITITEPGKNPQPYRFDLDAGLVRIGRRSENEIIIQCGSASGSHAEMVRVSGGFELRDCGSTNGIIKNGERIQTWCLTDGDRLLLGDVVFDFQLNEEEREVLAKESSPTDKLEKPESKPRPEKTEEPEMSERSARPKPTPVVASAGSSGVWLVFVFLLLGPIAFHQGCSMRRDNEIRKAANEALRNQPISIAPVQGSGANDDVFAQPSSDGVDPSNAVGTPEGVPEEIEGWENRERSDGLREDDSEGGEAATEDEE